MGKADDRKAKAVNKQSKLRLEIRTLRFIQPQNP